MSKPIIVVENLSKKYLIGENIHGHGARTFRDIFDDKLKRILSRKERQHKKEATTIWALKEVSFEVGEGEVVGIIGRNGAGKSTLLKILSRITEPTVGRVILRGRVASLLEVGTGFSQELTGRENIYLNGSILGMRKTEIDKRFDEIVQFAEIEKFLDTPVKRYSSGMYVRLAFAVAAHLEPEVLLVDEVLAVGDAQFQKKCLGKMEEAAQGGKTVVFVSHNMVAIEGLCSKGILLEKGRIERIGETIDITRYYIDNLFLASPRVDLSTRTDRTGDGRVRLTSVVLRGERNNIVDHVPAGSKCALEFSYVCEKGLNDIQLAFTVSDHHAQNTFRPSSQDTGFSVKSAPTKGKLICRIPRLPLVPGNYRVTTLVTSNGIWADYVQGAYILTVEGGDFYGTGRVSLHSPVLLDHEWAIEGE